MATNQGLLTEILGEVSNEIERSAEKHAPHNSVHETYGILMEEVAEFFDEIRQQKLNPYSARKELVQIASVAIKAIHDLRL